MIETPLQARTVRGLLRRPLGSRAGVVFEVDLARGELVDAVSGARAANARATTRTVIRGGRLRYAPVNTPAFGDHGLSIEPAATNLLPYSNDLDNASAWSAVNAVITAEGGFFRLTNNSTPDYHYLTPNSKTVGESTTNTMTVDAKAGTAGVLIISEAAGSWNRVRFNLNSGTIENEDGATGKIVPLADGWFRCSATFTTPADQPNGVWWLEVALAGQGYGSYAGTGEYIYLRRPQLEAGPASTAYIPTGAGTVSRAADAVACPLSRALKNILSTAEGSARAEGTLVVRDFVAGFNWALLPAGVYHSIISCSAAPLSLLSMKNYGGWFAFISYDGAFVREVALNPAQATPYDFAVRWISGGDLQVGGKLSSASTWTWGAAGAFDGAFVMGSNLHIGYSPSCPFQIGRVTFHDKWLEEPR